MQNISDESDIEKKEFAHQIQSLYAYDLFAKKMFKESMKEFFELDTDPCDVIRLFPDLLPQDTIIRSASSPSTSMHSSLSTPNIAELESKDLENGLLALIDYLTDVRANLKLKFTQSGAESKLFGQNITTLLSIIDTTLLKCYLQVKRCMMFNIFLR